jgi:hypothetical protein
LDTTQMNIYFSWSIKGADLAKENYPAIIEELQKYGVVLTEHIWKLAQWIQINVADSPEWVFEADRNFIDQSDIVIAEVSAPSLWVWRELAYAQYVRKIPIYCFHIKDARVSWMVLGNEYIQTSEYGSIEEIQSL